MVWGAVTLRSGDLGSVPSLPVTKGVNLAPAVKLNHCPPKAVGILNPRILNVTLFGNKVCVDDQVKMRSLGRVLI